MIGVYTGKDWLKVLLWWALFSAGLWLLSTLDGGLGYATIGALAAVFAMTRHELGNMRRELNALSAKLGGGAVG